MNRIYKYCLCIAILFSTAFYAYGAFTTDKHDKFLMKYGLKGLVVEHDLIAIITIISNDYTDNPLKERLNPPNSSIGHKFKFVKLLKDSGIAPYDLEKVHELSFYESKPGQYIAFLNYHEYLSSEPWYSSYAIFRIEKDNSVPSISFILGGLTNQSDSKLENVEEKIHQSLLSDIKRTYNMDILDDSLNAKSKKLQWKKNSPYQRVNLRFGCPQRMDGSSITNCTHPAEWPSEIYFGHAFIASNLISKEAYENLPLNDPWALKGTWRHGSFFIEKLKKTEWTYYCGYACPGK